MNFDGITLSCVTQELTEKLLGGVIRKIYQPHKDLLIVNIWIRKAFRLLISVSCEARIHLTEQNFKNPQKPSVFCMLLRSRLGGGIIEEIKQRGLDRVLDIHIQNQGNGFILSIEPMGKYSNCVLIKDNQVVDSLKRKKGKRTLLPGKKYQAPPTQDKHNPLLMKPDKFKELLNKNKDPQKIIWKEILENIEGIGPRIAKEIPLRAKIKPSRKLADLSPTQLDALEAAFDEIFNKVKRGQWEPCVYYQDNEPVNWAPFNLLMYNDLQRERKISISQALDEYFHHQQAEGELEDQLRKLMGIVQKEFKKIEKALLSVKVELEKSKKYDLYKRKADLLLANQARIDKPGEKVELEDIFETNQRLITIRLDPRLTIIENANKYYQKYKKLKRAQKKLRIRREELKLEKRYLLEMKNNLEQADTVGDLKNLEEELRDEGYLKPKEKSPQEKEGKKAGPRKLKINGYRVLIGKSGKQNDRLVRNASKSDLWFHVKDLPGAHVILKTGKTRKKISQEVLYKASQVAAYYSKARNSSQVPVSYTQVKYLKKPKGAKPGLVLCQKEDVITVTPKDSQGL